MNDNDEDYEELTDEELDGLLGTAAHMGTVVERQLSLTWLRKNAAKFLFADGLDPKLQEYGTTVLEMVADAIESKEHWQGGKETLQ